MREPYSSSHCVVIGIDGSRSALQAALWAVDEAADRDVPLRLVCAIDSSESNLGQAATEQAAAENAIRDAFAAIESRRKPVKIEAKIVRDRPIAALLEESRSAALVCVGSTGLKHAMDGRIGSTALALAASARCPVAVVPITAVTTPAGSVLAVVDESPSSRAVLGLAVREAHLRGVPLHVLTAAPHEGNGMHDANEAAAVSARLERYLAPWRRSHPTLEIQPIASHGGVINYLEHLHRNAQPVQLLAVDPGLAGPTDILLGPSGRAALNATRCILLIGERLCRL
jgi:nucleotide-binding universal stress UspA family protein